MNLAVVILMKKITNDYFLKFRNIVERSMSDSSQFDDCLKDMINASFDDHNKVYVYTDTSYNMEVLKLDEYTKDFQKRRRNEIPNLKEHQPSAVDAVCVNKDNESAKKMLSSVWLIAYLYSTLSEQISDEKDILKFARENITFITVVNSKKNEKFEETIGATWEKDGSFYTPQKFLQYKRYYFKDVYVLTEKGLRFFIESFE